MCHVQHKTSCIYKLDKFDTLILKAGQQQQMDIWEIEFVFLEELLVVLLKCGH